MPYTEHRRSPWIYVLAGITIALFGIPLGIGGLGVLVGLLGALAGILIGYYAVTGTFLLVGAMFISLGLIRVILPEMWDNLVMFGFIRFEGPVEFVNHLSPTGQAFVMLVFASVFVASGVGLWRLGKYFLRGLRSLMSQIFDWTRASARSVRRRWRQDPREGLPACPRFVGTQAT